MKCILSPTNIPQHTHIHTQQNILSKCRPEGPENIQDVSAAVMPKKTVEYSVLCYLVSHRGVKMKEEVPPDFRIARDTRHFLFFSFFLFEGNLI